MEELIKIEDRLNMLLEVENIDQIEIVEIANQLFRMKKVQLEMIDFDIYNEANRAELVKKKLAAIEKKDLETAFNLRMEERVYIKYINFRKYFNVQKSLFYPDSDKLVYYHLGTALNDRIIKAQLF